MPYKSNADLPAETEKYSDAAKTRFRKTFNAVAKHSKDEGRAFAAAHASAKKHAKAEHKSKLNREMGYDGSSK